MVSIERDILALSLLHMLLKYSLWPFCTDLVRVGRPLRGSGADAHGLVPGAQSRRRLQDQERSLPGRGGWPGTFVLTAQPQHNNGVGV